MITKLFVATSNAHKIQEINVILSQNMINIKLISPKDIKDDSEPIEDGNTFIANASIKANYWHHKTNLPTIADDSGLCIEFLNNFPGIYSARFMKNHTYQEKNELIIKALDDAPSRNASFHCALSYIDEFNVEHQFEGILNGKIADKVTGSNGFGYDPIFYIEELQKTAGELSPDEKNRVSHRALAFKQWVEYVKNN